jgi:anti-sigma-K factor RskA
MNDELDSTAAEYVLGTLPEAERQRFSERMRSDAGARQAVRFWQERLALLDQTAAAVTPRPEVWTAIERATGAPVSLGTSDPGSNIVQLRRRLAVWRGAAIAAGALAAALAGVAVLDPLATPPDSGRYVAVVDAGGREPALIAEVDTVAGVIRIRSLAAEAPAGRSLELWHVPEGREPRSLGILNAGLDAQTVEGLEIGPVNGVIAVSVEPEGGSPSGAPTGPIVYSGRLIPVE